MKQFIKRQIELIKQDKEFYQNIGLGIIIFILLIFLLLFLSDLSFGPVWPAYWYDSAF